MARLANAVVVVTGAGSGIGRATALQMVHEGAHVAAWDLDRASGEETVAAIQEAGGHAHFIEADVSTSVSVANAFTQTKAALGSINGIVNVVGVSGRRWGDGPIADCTEEGWDRVLTINLKSMFLCCKYAVQAMLAQGVGGSVVNIASVLGMVGGDADFGTHAYATSKGGIISLTRSIASYYAPQNIRANVICPGLIATNMSKRAQGSTHIRERLRTLQPLTGDFGTPEDVAHAACYLTSQEARFVTGAVLTVDGGWTVR